MSGDVKNPPGSAVERRLIEFLEQITAHSPMRLEPATPIFGTGRFDSLALVQLVAWAETEIGSRLDVSRIDFRSDWKTVRDVAAFVEAALKR